MGKEVTSLVARCAYGSLQAGRVRRTLESSVHTMRTSGLTQRGAQVGGIRVRVSEHTKTR